MQRLMNKMLLDRMATAKSIVESEKAHLIRAEINYEQAKGEWRRYTVPTPALEEEIE